MSVKKAELKDSEKQFCLAELKRVDSAAYDELCKDETAPELETIWEFILKILADEDKLNSSLESYTKQEGIPSTVLKDSVVVVVKGLAFETFRVDINRTKTIHPCVYFTRTENGTRKEFMRPINILTTECTDEVMTKNAASIIIEIIAVLCTVLGIDIKLTSAQLEEAVVKLEPYMTMIKNALHILAYSWKNTSSIQVKAMAIITFVKHVYSAGVLTQSIKIIISYKSWFERGKAFLTIVLFLRKVCLHPSSFITRIERVLEEQKGTGVFQRKIEVLCKLCKIRASLDLNYIF